MAAPHLWNELPFELRKKQSKQSKDSKYLSNPTSLGKRMTAKSQSFVIYSAFEHTYGIGAL